MNLVGRLVVLSAAIFALWLIFGPGQQSLAHPPVPRDPAGVAKCDSCHGPGAQPSPGPVQPPALPVDHSTYTASSCATCHAAVIAGPLGASYAKCATCHTGEGQTVKLPDGSSIKATIDLPKYLASVHGTFSCDVCHPSQDKIPHDKLTAEGRRQFTQDMSQRCESCHTGPTENYSSSFHGMAARLGVIRAAACADCHTAHAVQAPAHWSLADRATQCATCHQGANETFASGWMGHREPSVGWFPVVMYAQKGFVALTAIVVGLGIVHVEMDGLRWLTDRVRRRKEEDEES